MRDAWVLVANSSEARLFRLDGQHLSMIEQFLHPDSRRKDQEITSDHSGHRETRSTGDASTAVYGSFPEPTDPQEFEFDRFARELSQTLDRHRTQNDFRELVLVAPPKFHGMLNKHMPDSLANCITHNVQKDYTSLPERELMEHLTPFLH